MFAKEKPSKRSRRVTLVDVAKDAGVCRATASLVLRGSPLVSEERRDRVLASMNRLGYVYNRAAASLRSNRSQVIGIVITDIANPFFAQLTVGIEEQLDQVNYALLLATTSDDIVRQNRLLSTMHEYLVDGLLVVPANGSSVKLINQLRQWRRPFVLVTRYLPEVESDYVGADNELGADLAVEHLIGLGHKRIAFIGGAETSSARSDRLRGYLNALTRHGLPVEDRLTITSPPTREGGYKNVQELLNDNRPPTAALCYNDVVAFGVMLGLRAQGLVPGQEFAVVGFDDIAEAALWRPALTTVSIQPRQIGSSAAHLLLERIANPDGPPRQIILAPNLVIRQSCGAN
jgi:LacI family transcriptional regulator